MTCLRLAMFARLGLLLSIAWVMGLVDPWCTVFDQQISGRDIILMCGGLFLLTKSTREIHASFEIEGEADAAGASAAFYSVLVQIAILDIVFSLDSVITAVGRVPEECGDVWRIQIVGLAGGSGSKRSFVALK